jgi:hypothetical protein
MFADLAVNMDGAKSKSERHNLPATSNRRAKYVTKRRRKIGKRRGQEIAVAATAANAWKKCGR